MSRARNLLTLLLLSSFVLAACNPLAPPSKPANKPSDASPGKPAAAAKASPEPKVSPTPTMVVASPTVQLVRDGRVASAQPAVSVFLWGNPASTDRDLKLAKDAGFSWIKQRFEWRNIEKTKKSAFEWSEPDRIVDAVNKAGLGMIVRLDNQPDWARRDKIFPRSGPPDKMEDWKDYVEAVSERYKGKIAAYEVWNEPNLAREWGDAKPDAQAYTDLLKTAYTAIKKMDPNALVISAGLSPTTEASERAVQDRQFLADMYAAGAGQAFDLLGVNAAGFKAEPEADPALVAQNPALTNNDPSPVDAKRVYSFRHVEDMRALMVQNGDERKQVAILEMGWTSDPRPNSPYAWFAVSEDQKGDYLTRAFQFAQKNWQPWIGMMSVIYIASPDWTTSDEQYYWSLTNPDGSLRPAYNALKAMPKS